MKRFCYLLVSLLVSLTIMCCENPSGGAGDIPASPPSSDTSSSTATDTSDAPTKTDEPTDPSTPTGPSTTTDPSTPALSTNASLSALSLSVGILSPAFSPDVLAYTATVDTSFPSITLTGKAVDEKATLDANDRKVQALGDGTNTLSYTVTAEDGSTKKTYTVTVTKEKDTAAPEITQFTLNNATVDTTEADAIVTGTFVAEDPSGPGEAGDPFGFFSDALTGTLNATVTKNDALSTFTRVVYDWSFTIPKGTAQGSFDFRYLGVEDTLGNARMVYDLPGESTFTSTRAGDNTPPTLTNFEVTSTELIDDSYLVTGTISFNDASGISPNKTHLTLYHLGIGGVFPDVTLDSITDTTAVYNWSFSIPKSSTPATCSITDVNAYDTCGNHIDYSTSPQVPSFSVPKE